MASEEEIRDLQAKKLRLEIDKLEASGPSPWATLDRLKREKAARRGAGKFVRGSVFDAKDRAMASQEAQVRLARARGTSSI